MLSRHLRRVLIVTFVVLFGASGLLGAEGLWVKGNTHAHTTISDGNASPEAVVSWYKSHGYQFLVLTDHGKMAPAEVFERNTDANFVLIRGVEISATRKFGDFNVHMNAIGVSSPLRPIPEDTIASALKANMEMISRSGAIVQLNHPSFHLRDRDALSKVSGTFLMELYNHSSRGDTYGPIENPIFELAYEAALTAGKRAFAVAADDTHDYQTFGPKNANPGGGWVMVHVTMLTRDEILKNLAAGDFYASTGVEIDRYTIEGKNVRVSVKPVDGVTYTILFIGQGGIPLSKSTASHAEYHLRGGPLEKYVRVRINASDGTAAWLQPVWPVN
jgi:hypothetical protein